VSTGAPLLTVIVASALPRDAVPEDLASLLRQAQGRSVEIILACAGVEPSVAAPGTELHVVPPGPDATLPELLGAALARARGEIVAITDPSCALDDHWVTATLEAHRAPHPVIGGAVEPDGLRTMVDWGAYFSEYGAFMLPLAEGPIDQVPGNNFSLKRSALARGREFVAGEFWKAYWCRRLQAEGVTLHAAPSVLVRYRRSFRVGPLLVRRFHHGRCFAGMRLAELGRGRRIVYCVGALGLPVVFCARLLRALLPKRRRLRELALALPVVVLAMGSWAAGECWGYLTGRGESCRHVR